MSKPFEIMFHNIWEKENITDAVTASVRQDKRPIREIWPFRTVIYMILNVRDSMRVENNMRIILSNCNA